MLNSVGVIVLNLVRVSVFPQQPTSFEKRQTNKAQTAPPTIKPVQTSSVIKVFVKVCNNTRLGIIKVFNFMLKGRAPLKPPWMKVDNKISL